VRCAEFRAPTGASGFTIAQLSLVRGQVLTEPTVDRRTAPACPTRIVTHQPPTALRK
jgi:hypothetical protein